jgi:hypothetical protein
MDERIVLLRAHQSNIDRYQGLLETKLSDAEKQYFEKRLREEHFAVGRLKFVDPEAAGDDSRGAEMS